MKKRFLAAMSCSISLMLMAGCVGQSSETEIIQQYGLKAFRAQV